MIKYTKMGSGLQDRPEHAQLIGQIIAAWNDIEDNCCLLLSEFLFRNLTNATAIIYALNAPKARIDVLAAVGRKRLGRRPEILENFEALIPRIYAALNRRNELAHALYGSDQDNRVRLIKPRYGFSSQIGNRVLTIKELKSTYKEAVSTKHSILKLFSDVSESRSTAHALKPGTEAPKGKKG